MEAIEEMVGGFNQSLKNELASNIWVAYEQFCRLYHNQPFDLKVCMKLIEVSNDYIERKIPIRQNLKLNYFLFNYNGCEEFKEEVVKGLEIILEKCKSKIEANF